MNIIIMYADDLGFGDVSCYGAKEISTPNIDLLAREGIKFHQGYASAATCTPSRYSLLTGSYPFRNSRAAILPGDAPLLIDLKTPTMPGMLKEAGFTTAVVGKWHLGLGNSGMNWNEKISPSPREVGFDFSYIMAATNDRVPCVYVKDGMVENLDPNDPIEVTYDWDKAFPGQPTGRHNPELLTMMYSHGHDCSIINGVSRIGHMKGGEKALWDDETMADVFLEKATDFIKDNKEKPFFLYYAFHEPHVPRIPAPRFKGATTLGPRGDVIVEMDWCVGQIMKTLEKEGIKEETLVIFSSDNGPVLNDGYKDGAVEKTGNHKPSGPLRGGKYSMYDGGTRVPLILSWPGTVQPGESDALVSHLDFYSSFAHLAGVDLSEKAAPDSINLIDALLGKNQTGRDELVTEGTKGKTIIRHKNWVFIPPHEGPAINPNTKIELGNSCESQLYNLDDDLGQICNMAEMRTDVVIHMKKKLKEILSGEKTR